MRKLQLITFGLLLSLAMQAQDSFDEALKQGDLAFNQGEFKTAIGKYLYAGSIDPSNMATVTARLNKLYNRLDGLQKDLKNMERRAKLAEIRADSAFHKMERINERLDSVLAELAIEKTSLEEATARAVKAETEADEARRKAEEAQRKAEEAQKRAEEAFRKASKAIDAFEFYEDRFALAFGEDSLYYFIDKSGKMIERLGTWKNANLFGTNLKDFAWVQSKNGQEFMLDTLGNTFHVEKDIYNLESGIELLDLSNYHLKSIPSTVTDQKQLKGLIMHLDLKRPRQLFVLGELKELKYLYLTDGTINFFHPDIGNLHHLVHLSLSNNQLESLPLEINNLKNLKILDLSGNPIPDEEKKKIKELVPAQCRVIF